MVTKLFVKRKAVVFDRFSLIHLFVFVFVVVVLMCLLALLPTGNAENRLRYLSISWIWLLYLLSQK